MSPVMPQLTDEALIPGLRAGDEATLQVLIDRYWERAYRVVVHQVGGDPGAAEDVTQQTFVEVLNGAGRFEEGRRFRPWFFRVLRNTAADHRRAQGRRWRHERGAAESRREREVDASADATRDEAAALIRAGVSQLEAPLREVISLRYLEGLSLAETAEALAIPQGTVSTRARRGLEALKQRLSPELAATLTSAGLGAALADAALRAPGAPAAAEVAAASTLRPEALPPTPAPPTAAQVAGRVARPRRVAPALGAIAVIGLGAAAVYSLALDGPGSRVAGRLPAGAPRAGAQTLPAGDAGGSPTAPADEASTSAPSTTPRRVSVVAVVSSATTHEGLWAAAIPLDQHKALWRVNREVEARELAGRSRGGYSLPAGAVGLEREDGRLELDVPAGEHVLAVGARGCSTHVEPVRVPASGVVAVDLSLERVEPATLDLVVRDDEGRPLRWTPTYLYLEAAAGVPPLVVRPPEIEPGSPLWLVPAEGKPRSYSLSLRDELRTDQAGTLQLELAPGTYRLRGGVTDWDGGRALELPREGIELTLAAGRSQQLALTVASKGEPHGDVELRIVDRGGRPVADAALEVLRGSWLEKRYNEPLRYALRWPPDEYAVRPHPDGSRLLREVGVGAIGILVRSSFWGGRSEVFELEEGERRQLTVVLDEPLQASALKLTLRDVDTGAPLVGEFEVSLDASSGRGWRVSTDEQGVLRRDDVRPGTKALRVWGAGYAPSAPQEIELRAGEELELELELGRGRALQGVVTAELGVSAGTVRVVAEDERLAFEGKTELVEGGGFRFEALPPGSFTLHVSSVPGYVVQRFSGVTPSGDPVVLTLAETPRWALHVVDEADAPVPGAEVSISTKDFAWAVRGETDVEGRIEFRGPLTGAWGRFDVEPRSLSEPEFERTGKRFEPWPEEGFEERVVVVPPTKPRQAVVHGRVVDGRGQPVAGAKLRVHHWSGRGGGSSGGPRTDREGRFEVEVPAPATITVGVSRGRLQGWGKARVRDGGRHELEVVVRPAVQVGGVVRGVQPGSWVRVIATRNVGDAVSQVDLHPEALGELPFTLGYLSPSRWTLLVEVHDEVLTTLELDLRDGQDRTDVVLDAGVVRPR